MGAGRVRVRIGEHSIDARGIGFLTRHGDVRLLIRPAATNLAPTSHGNHEPTCGWLPATVIDVAHRGRGYDHVVHCAAGSVTAVHSSAAYPIRTSVQLRLDPDHYLAYPEPAGPAPAPQVTQVIPEPRRTSPVQVRHFASKGHHFQRLVR